MEIIKFKKIGRSKYKVTLNQNELIIYEEVILKNNLLRKKDISLELLELIMEENRYYEIYDQSLSYIEKKMRTEKELHEYLIKKDFDELLIEDVIERLKKENLINEEKYIQAYINDKIALSKDGPFKIKRNLLDLELHEYLIDEYLSKVSTLTWQEKLNKIIDKRLNLMKNKSEYQIKNKLKEDLFNLGYDKSLIELALNKINKNDSDSIKKEYDKAYSKYSKKYQGSLLNNQIKSYLYRKGYSIDDITSLISSNDDY